MQAIFDLFKVCRIGDAPGNESFRRTGGQGEFDEQGRRHVFYIVRGFAAPSQPPQKNFQIFQTFNTKTFNTKTFNTKTPSP